MADPKWRKCICKGSGYLLLVALSLTVDYYRAYESYSNLMMDVKEDIKKGSRGTHYKRALALARIFWSKMHKLRYTANKAWSNY